MGGTNLMDSEWLWLLTLRAAQRIWLPSVSKEKRYCDLAPIRTKPFDDNLIQSLKRSIAQNGPSDLISQMSSMILTRSHLQSDLWISAHCTNPHGTSKNCRGEDKCWASASTRRLLAKWSICGKCANLITSPSQSFLGRVDEWFLMRVCHCDLEVTVSSLSLVLRNPLQEGLVGNLHLAKSPNIVQRVEQRNLAGAVSVTMIVC